MNEHKAAVTILGLGAMGRAIAARLTETGYATTVWNRTPGKGAGLGTEAGTITGAIEASPTVLITLLDYASVHAVLDPIADRLAGKTLINLTSGTPAQARDMATWAAKHGAEYLDGGMMAVPPMIGKPGASILYSGPKSTFDGQDEMLGVLAENTYFGEDPGVAALVDLALLSAMYSMFIGFFHATAMVGTAGISASEFAPRVKGWLNAMAESLPYQAATIDSGDYRAEEQSVDFNRSAYDVISQASRDQGLGTEVLEPLRVLMSRRIAEGHGADAFVSLIETIRNPQ